MNVWEDLFPSEQSTDYAQTRWCSDWQDLIGGLEYVVDLVIEHAAELGPSIDQAGFAVFYLERQRVELSLKALLDADGMPAAEIRKLGHSLPRLWAACEKRLGPGARWDEFSAAHAELVQAIDRADPTSTTFRYPVDKEGASVSSRPEFINLRALNDRVEALDYAAQTYIDRLAGFDG